MRSASSPTKASTSSPANLFTLVALMDKYDGDRAQAQAEFAANLVNGALPQSYVDLILGQYDVVGVAGEDPEMQFRVTQPVNTDEGNVNGWEVAWQHFFGRAASARRPATPW
jgi:hypothetical protein